MTPGDDGATRISDGALKPDEQFSVQFDWASRRVKFIEKRGAVVMIKSMNVPMVVVKGVMQEILRVEAHMEGLASQAMSQRIIAPQPGSGGIVP